MAWRGRGRGRGGFTVSRHDIQLSEEEKGSDVPHRFPQPVLGQMPPSASAQEELTAEQQRLMIRFERMRTGYRSSPFFMEPGGPAQRLFTKSVPDVSRYLEPDCAEKPERRRPLHEVITLHEKYMPRELFSEKEERKSARARKSISKTAYKKEVELDLTLLEADAEGEKKDDKDKSDDDKEEGVAEEDADDEFDMEDDDYYQGENYDDDEEYGDVDDGGGNDEPYF